MRRFVAGCCAEDEGNERPTSTGPRFGALGAELFSQARVVEIPHLVVISRNLRLSPRVNSHLVGMLVAWVIVMPYGDR